MQPRGNQNCRWAGIAWRPSRAGCRIARMRSFDTLVGEADAADVTGWGFDWLDGRATEERPPWGYARMLAARLATARAALDVDTGGGEVVAEAPILPARMCVTEAWPPNAARARELLVPRGVEVYETDDGEDLPLPDESFDLVTSRHPVRPAWEDPSRPGARWSLLRPARRPLLSLRADRVLPRTAARAPSRQGPPARGGRRREGGSHGH